MINMTASIIPTAFGAIGPSFSKKKWWLRSPDTYDTNDAYPVRPGGNVYNSGVYGDVDNSYGRRSPTTDRDYNAWLVDPGGDTVGFSFDSYVSDSYGRIISPYMGYDGNYVWCVTSSGGLDYFSVDISYGLSPNMNNIGYMCYVSSYGDSYINNGIHTSYGLFQIYSKL